jgi:peptide/nickel transport system permease protein
MLFRYLLRRSAHAAFLLFGISALCFALVDLAPGDYLTDARMNPQISAETAAGLRGKYGLDRPLPIRYSRWLRSALAGDFGISMAYNLPASELLLPRMRNTLLLATTAVALTWLLGVPLGLWAAVARGRWPDRIISFAASAALSIPELLLATVALFLAVRTGLFPLGGMMSPSLDGPLAREAADVARHLILPCAVLVLGALPVVIRHSRSAVLDVIDSPFIVAARAHGIPETRILFRYLLRAAANPLISLAGLSIGTLLSASLIVEVIMGWPGLGPLLLEAVSARDIHLITGSVVLSGAMLIFGSLLADVLLYACDPRIRVDA